MSNIIFITLQILVLILPSCLKAQVVSDTAENNLFTINEQTKISFSIPNENFLFSNIISDSIDIDQLEEIYFKPFSNSSKFEAYKFYIKKIKIKNQSAVNKTISVMPGLNHIKSTFYMLSNGNFKSYTNDPGFNSNELSSFNLKTTNVGKTMLRNFTFKIKSGEVVELFYKFQMPNKTHFYDNNLNFYETDLYLENRRFGLWLEGIIFGSILGLLVFTLYSYSQIRDRTTLYFGLWLITAIGAVIGQNAHDGARFFEFIIYPLQENPLFSTHSFPTTVAGITGYSQAMMFVVFARNFIDLEKHHLIAYRLTNIYLVWYALHFFLFRLFNFEIDLRFIWYPLIISTFLVLVLIYYCAFQRYRSGMQLARLFIIGMLPYLIFRIFGLLGILGFQQPFAYLPDSGLEYFLNHPGVTQSVGLFLEAIIMSLVLAKRTKFLQDELNENIKKQVDEAEKQQLILEETVQDRTSELQEKSKTLEVVSNKLAKYIPPQIHEALFSGKYDTDITTKRRKLTVFFSDIKNFTSTAENLQPEDLTKYLNEYFSEMTKIALNHGATIDKYIGDSMMVFFGDPETKGEREDARVCVEMAIKMQERMSELRKKWLHEGFSEPFEIRIGINTGYCNVGNFGSDQRLTYTIIGGEVNVASRLESVADVNGLFLSYETYVHVQDMVIVEQKEAIKMKGINREIKIYSVKNRIKDDKNLIKVTKTKKPTKKELSEIEKLRIELEFIKTELKKISHQ